MHKNLKSEIICHSINPDGIDLVTFVLRYPRIIHSEFLTHRSFSKNAASSRAVPVKKLIEKIESDPFIPWHWYKNQKGMQGDLSVPLEGEDLDVAIKEWKRACKTAIEVSKILSGEWISGWSTKDVGLNVHKSIPNRLLEPFMWMETIVSTTRDGLENFFSQRAPHVVYLVSSKSGILNTTAGNLKHAHQILEENSMFKDGNIGRQIQYGAAEPHFQDLALLMKEAYELSEPKQVEWGEWHIPFGDQIEKVSDELRQVTNHLHHLGQIEFEQELPIRVAIARCARISYLNYENQSSVEDDLRLYNQLVKSGHWSPMEHVAQARNFYEDWKNWFGTDGEYNTDSIKKLLKEQSNFHCTWMQQRKFIES